MENNRVREARLYDKIKGKITCCTCERYCEIAKGERGFCGTRENIDGKLYTLVYGDISSVAIHPIEHKPLFHFYPGSRVLTVSTWSCNFECGWCFRKYLSKAHDQVGNGTFISPDDVLSLMRKHDCQGIAISFNEPTLLLEWTLDVFPLAKKLGYYTAYVTNGYMSFDALKLLAEHGLDAMNIDVKGDGETVRRECGGDEEKIWRNAVESKKLGMWIEITTLIIPGINDSLRCLEGIASQIKGLLGNDIPWHVNAYFPRDTYALKRFGLSTPESTLLRARDIGEKVGLHYIYAGGYPGLNQNTYCPLCKELLIERQGFGFELFHNRIGEKKRCHQCGRPIPIIGKSAEYTRTYFQ